MAKSVALKKKKNLKGKAENDVSTPRRTLAEIRTFCAARRHIFSDYYYFIIIIIIIIILFAPDFSRKEGLLIF